MSKALYSVDWYDEEGRRTYRTANYAGALRRFELLQHGFYLEARKGWFVLYRVYDEQGNTDYTVLKAEDTWGNEFWEAEEGFAKARRKA